MASARAQTPNDSVLLCRSDDPRLGLAWNLYDRTGGFEQMTDGPVMLVITPHTPDVKCDALARRFGVSSERLIEFRNQLGSSPSSPECH